MALNNLTRVTGSGFGTETSINTAGIITAASFSGDGSSLTGVVGSGSGVVIREEGSNVGTAQTINFVGTGVTATISGAVATIEITSSGGGGSGISSIFEDTTPRLGGNLNIDSKEITGISTVDSGSGTLFVKTDIVSIKKHDDSEWVAQFNSDGPVNLFFNGSKKFETTSAGAEIHGDLTATSLSVGSALDITSTNSSSTIQADNSSQPFYIQGLNNSLISILAGSSNQGRVTVYNQGKVELAHAGNVKFETTSTGAEITGNLTATSFSGNVTGTATTATNVTIADESSDTSCFLLYSTEATGNISPKTGSNLTFNSSSGTLTASTFVGDGSGLTGVVASGTGVIVRDSGSLVGTAGTIDFGNNVSVSPISAGVVTVTAAAGTIAGINTSGTTKLNNLNVAGVSTFQNLIKLADDVIIRLGDGNDTDFFHTGSQTNIKTTSGNSFEIHTYAFKLRNQQDNASLIIADQGGSVDLYYNNSKKFETTNTGAVVTGILTATSFSGNGASVTNVNAVSIGGTPLTDLQKKNADTDLVMNNQILHFGPANTKSRIRWSGTTSLWDLLDGDLKFRDNTTDRFTFERTTGNFSAASVNVSGVITASSFSGSGANLTNLPASGISTAFTNVQVTYDISASGNNYRITGPGYDASENNPDLYLVRGQRYRFINGTGTGHPFRIQSDTSGTAYTDGVSGDQDGTQDFNVQNDAPARLYYQCTIHSTMIGNIYIVGGSDWRMTDVTTAQTPEIYTNLNVGIGTDNPNQKLHVHSSGTSYARFTDESSGIGATDGVVIGLDHPHTYVWNYEAGDFVVATDATERFRITSAGKLILPTSSPGIQFGSNDSGGNITSQTLDDYEEGTWTPVIKSGSNTISYSGGNQYFKYTKIGGLVTVTFALNASTTSGTTGGGFKIQGLPFTSKNLTNLRTIGTHVCYYGSGLRASTWPNFVHVGSNKSEVDIYTKTASNSNYDRDTVASVGSDTYFFWQVTYETDS